MAGCLLSALWPRSLRNLFQITYLVRQERSLSNAKIGKYAINQLSVGFPSGDQAQMMKRGAYIRGRAIQLMRGARALSTQVNASESA